MSKLWKTFTLCSLDQSSISSPSKITKSKTDKKTNLSDNESDENSWYTTVCGDVRLTLPVRYKELAPIGHGAFGSVIRAKDSNTGNYVAIKKIRKPFETATYAKRTYRELKLLTDLNHPDAQVVQLYNVFTPEKSLDKFSTIYLVFNYVVCDLHKFIKKYAPFSEEDIKRIIYLLLRGLKYIHSAGVLHRDLKPMNIGVDKTSDIIILDFGLARTITQNYPTGYVVSKWWRAPEVFVNWEEYDAKLDIWSVGCIMAELIRHEPLFPGTDHIDLLHKILNIVGTPDLKELKDICTPEAYNYIMELEFIPKANFHELFGIIGDNISGNAISGVSSKGVNLLDRLLTFDYRMRPTAAEAIADPFFESYQNLIDEPTIRPIIDEHADQDYTTEKWKSIIWKMIKDFQPPPWADTNLTDANE